PQGDRRVPVVAILVVLHRVADRADPIRVGRNRAFGAGSRVGHADDAALQIRINAPRLLQIGNGEETVAAADDEPVVLADAFGRERIYAPAPRAVVLQAPAD